MLIYKQKHVCMSTGRIVHSEMRFVCYCTVACEHAYVCLMGMYSFKSSLSKKKKTGLALYVSHPIMIHIAFIQGPVAMAATASIA